MSDAQIYQMLSYACYAVAGLLLVYVGYFSYILYSKSALLTSKENKETLKALLGSTIKEIHKDTLEQKIIRNVNERTKDDRILWERDATYDKHNVRGRDLDFDIMYSITTTSEDYVHFRTYDLLPNGNRGDETLGIHISPKKELLTLWMTIGEKVGRFPSEEEEKQRGLCIVAKVLGVEDEACSQEQ